MEGDSPRRISHLSEVCYRWCPGDGGAAQPRSLIYISSLLLLLPFLSGDAEGGERERERERKPSDGRHQISHTILRQVSCFLTEICASDFSQHIPRLGREMKCRTSFDVKNPLLTRCSYESSSPPLRFPFLPFGFTFTFDVFFFSRSTWPADSVPFRSLAWKGADFLLDGPIRCCLLRGCQKRKVPFPPMTIVAGTHFSVRIRGEDCKILSGQLRRRREGGTYLSFSLRGEKGEEKEGPSSCQARRRGRRPS